MKNWQQDKNKRLERIEAKLFLIPGVTFQSPSQIGTGFSLSEDDVCFTQGASNLN